MKTLSPHVRDIAQRVAERFRPERIILFGSQAAAHADADSDIDLLVVMECPGRPVEQAIAIRQFLNYPRPMDLLVRTAETERRIARWLGA
jgi:predicted nucleotidyltransferase